MKRKQTKKKTLPKKQEKLIFNSKNKREKKKTHKKLTDTVQKEREREMVKYEKLLN